LIPEGWQLKRLGDLLERVVVPVIPEPTKSYREIGIRSHGKGLFYKEPVTGQSLGAKRVFEIVPNCLILNIVFAWEQAVAITTENEIGMIASHRFPMFKPRGQSCDIKYLINLFKTPYGKYLLNIGSPGGAGRNKTLGQEEFSRITISLPPLQEQTKIAEFLSCWDRAIELTNNLFCCLTQIRTQLLRNTINSADAKLVKLKTLTTHLARGITPKYANSQNEYPILNQKALRWGAINKRDLKYLEPELASQVGQIELIQEGDVVINSTGDGTIGRAYFFETTPGYLAIDSHITLIRTNSEKLNPLFLELIFESPEGQRQILNLTTGSTGQAELSPTSLGHFPVPLISLTAQKELINRFRSMRAHLRCLEQLKGQLILQKQALMHQLLTGKTRVKVS